MSLPRIGSYTVVSCWQDECVHRVPVHTEQQDTLLQETALVGTGREPGMSLPSGVARLKYESPGPGAQPEEQGKEDGAAWEEGKTGRHRTGGLFSSVYCFSSSRSGRPLVHGLSAGSVCHASTLVFSSC